MRKSKHTKKFIKEEIQNELGVIKVVGNDVWAMEHLVNLLRERGDDGRIGILVDLYKIVNTAEELNVSRFYWWIKDYPLSRVDVRVYLIFDKVLEERGLMQVKPTEFSGRGEELVRKFDEWKGNAGNDEVDLLKDYFDAVINHLYSYNKAMISSVKTVLGDFGWVIWEEFIVKQYGGKLMYLEAAEEDVERSENRKGLLIEIQSCRDKALSEGRVDDYDKIGNDLCNKSIKEVYDDLCKSG